MKKNQKRPDVWYNLDNAANIFPAISDDRNTNVFRLSCELKETVDKELLQTALDAAMKNFGHFRVVMRRGLFWFYLERTELSPKVEFEMERPCSRLFYISRKELLFKVSYYHHRINLEVFHSVADGTGALQLLRAIVYHYIVLAFRERLPEQLPPLGNQSPPSQRSEDSFLHHYDPDLKKTPHSQRAYTIGGHMLPAGSIGIICGQCSTSQLLALAKSRGVSATAYLTALLICAIYTELMPARSRRRPIGVTVPVDLRRHFPSETARNFFSVTDISYTFDGAPADFDTVLADVTRQLGEKLKPEALAGRINYTTGVQKNIFARAVPLILKNTVLRAAYSRSEHATTCAISNVGRIAMPSAFDEFIETFHCLLNPTPIHRVKACICSYGDKFMINFSSCIAETQAQRYFFRHLAAAGVDVVITCNGVDEDEIL